MCKIREGFCLIKSRYERAGEVEWQEPGDGGHSGQHWPLTINCEVSYHSIYLRKTLKLKGNRHLIQDTQRIKSKLTVEGRPVCLGISNLLTVTFLLCSCSHRLGGKTKGSFLQLFIPLLSKEVLKSRYHNDL